MRPVVQEVQTAHTPESLVHSLPGEEGVTLLLTSSFDSPSSPYSFVVAEPYLTFRSFGSRCEIREHGTPNKRSLFGNPWHLLDSLMPRYELLDEVDLPFPLGGCFGYWGYDLKKRGPYCGCHGYLGFNRESHLSTTIRSAVCKNGLAHFNVGAGIVAGSNEEAEYDETMAKAAGFLGSLSVFMPDSLAPRQ